MAVYQEKARQRIKKSLRKFRGIALQKTCAPPGSRRSRRRDLADG
jgi:hypothetical protein